MKEDDLCELSINLGRALVKEIMTFMDINKDLSMGEILFINSTVISSLIAQVVFVMFKKDISTGWKEEYIDNLAHLAKLQLRSGKCLIEKERGFEL